MSEPKLETAISKVKTYYQMGQRITYVRNPLAWALYQTWREVDKPPDEKPADCITWWNKISPAGIYECAKCGQVLMTCDIDCYKFCHGCGRMVTGNVPFDRITEPVHDPTDGNE